MIVKSKGRKDTNFNQVVSYILSDKKRISNLYDTFMICHNIESYEPQGIIEEFKTNDQYRKRRKNGNVMYHEILAFSPEDRESVSHTMLEDIARKYIELRGHNALCLAKPHIEEKHIHIHFLFSGTELGSKQVLRINRSDFKEKRREIEQYQLERYPELNNSYVHSRDKEKYQNLDQERSHIVTHKADQIKKRKGRQTIKDLLGSRVCYLFKTASDISEFCQKLNENENLEIYFRKGQAEGIYYKNRKYRFTTLGVDKTALKEMRLQEKKKKQKQNDLDQLYKDREQRKEKNRNLGKDDIWGL